tara:strand:+ start:241 stop:1443 length:1203 start_codon:yes stop_codon:yes gene_type:complete
MSNLKDFQPPGYVAWQAVQTSSFTASAGRGYPINTTGGGVTVTLPAAASRGDTIEFSDYGAKFKTNNVILNINGLKFQGGSTQNPKLADNGQGMTIVYQDATHGWAVMQNSKTDILSEPPAGNTEYVNPGTYTWTVPNDVTSCCVVCIGGGGDSGTANSGQAGGGGALSYKNNISVTPGQTASITVGRGGVHSGNQGQSGTASQFTYSGTAYANAAGGQGGYGEGSGTGGSGGAGGQAGGNRTGGGDGGAGGQDQSNHGAPGGGGAGGYSGNGGNGANCPNNNAHNGQGGSGGGGGGGGKGGQSEQGGGGGGGVGLYGEGSSGSGGTGYPSGGTPGEGGTGGSSGSNGGDGQALHGGDGGAYGGGHGGSQSEGTLGAPGGGAVRVIWGPGRDFPNNAALI